MKLEIPRLWYLYIHLSGRVRQTWLVAGLSLRLVSRLDKVFGLDHAKFVISLEDF